MAKTVRKPGVTEKHYIAADVATSRESTMAVYGKLITGADSSPAALGITHPHGVDEPLHRSLVYGIQVSGNCVRLPVPREVALPEPDGPADGCGWDPEEYVVWKNLPRDWTTRRFHSRTDRLIRALTFKALQNPTNRPLSLVAISPTTTVEQQVKAIVQSWAGLQSEPNSTDTLGALWGNRSEPLSVAVTSLASDLDDELGAQIQPTDLTAATTVADIVNAVLS